MNNTPNKYDLLWNRGVNAYLCSATPKQVEDALCEDYEAGKITSEEADTVRYGYDHARTNKLVKEA